MVPTYFLSIALAVASLASLAMIWRAWRLPRFPGQRAFALSILATAWWAGVVACEHASDDPATKVFLAEFAWLGIVLAPGGWALFIWDYIHGQARAVPRALFPALIGVATAVWLMALTNEHHHLMYVETVPTGTPPHMTVNYFHGPLYFCVAALFWSGMALSEALLLYEIAHASPLYRTHFIGLAAAVLLPAVVNIGYATKTVMIGTADPTPLSFVVMNMVFYWLISRRQMFDLLPIAQSMLLEALPEPVLVVDTTGRIVVCNPAAQRLLGKQRLPGLPLALVPELRPVLARLDAAATAPNGASDGAPEAARDTDTDAAPLELAIGAPPRHFDVGLEPLRYGDRTVGRIVFLREISHRKAAEVRLQVAMAALEQQLASNQALQRQLREEAIRDALTGLHNRRFFAEIAPVMLAEAQRAGAPLAAAMVDVDHFKRLNDTHGHAAGDAVLRALGAFLKDGARESDMVFRMGGEEFLILLPHTPPGPALDRVDGWRAGFADETMPHDGIDLRATFSAGLALYPDDADDIEGLLARADRALYDAKTGGRNRTVRWRPSGPVTPPPEPSTRRARGDASGPSPRRRRRPEAR